MSELRIAGTRMHSAGLDPAASERPQRTESGSAGFVERVTQAIEEADEAQKTADHEIRELAGGSGRTTETMLALGRAELSLQFVVALRNRAIQAYQEIMRLQV